MKIKPGETVVVAMLTALLILPSYARGGGGGGGSRGGGASRGGGGGASRGGGGGASRGGGGGASHSGGGGGASRGGAASRGNNSAFRPANSSGIPNSFNNSAANRGASSASRNYASVPNNGGFGGRAPTGSFGGGFNNIAAASPGNMNRQAIQNRPATLPANNRPAWAQPFPSQPAFNGRPGSGGFPGGNGYPAQRPSTPITGSPNRPAHLPTDGGFGGIAGTQNNFSNSRNVANINHNTIAVQAQGVRNNFNQFNQVNFNRSGYNHGWWGYPGSWYPSGWSAATAWTCAGFAALSSFLGMGQSTPVVVNYGDNIVYQGDTVYQDNRPLCSADQYYLQAQQQAALAAADQFNDSADRWQPLGVFSIAAPGQTQSNMLFQLAVNQNGILAGNFYDQLTNENAEVYGAVDRNTQRVTWTIGNNQNTVFDTSFGNLLGQDGLLLVHYSPTSTQEMVIVRLQPPPGS